MVEYHYEVSSSGLLTPITPPSSGWAHAGWLQQQMIDAAAENVQQSWEEAQEQDEENDFIHGYKWFRAWPTVNGTFLKSPVQGDLWVSAERYAMCTDVRFDPELSAYARAEKHLATGMRDHNCGFYCVYTPDRKGAPFYMPDMVLAEVILWDWIVEGTRGVRGRACRVEQVWVPKVGPPCPGVPRYDSERIAEGIVQVYGIPVSVGDIEGSTRDGHR